MPTDENNKYFYCWECGAKTLNEKGYSRILMLNSSPPIKHKICYMCANRIYNRSFENRFNTSEYRDDSSWNFKG